MAVLGGMYGVLEAEKASLPEVFHIEDLLDFSCEDIGGPIELQVSGVTDQSSGNAGERSISSSVEVKSELSLEPALEDFEVQTDLCVPCDDLADLQWLSSFVEDSFTVVDLPEVSSTYGGGFPSAMSTPNMKVTCDAYQPYQKASPVSVLENSSATSSELTGPDYSTVPGRARSKRSRTGARTWSSKILPTSSSVNSFESMGDDSITTSYSPIVSEDSLVEQDDEDSQSSKRCKLDDRSFVSNVSNNSSSSIKAGRKKNQDNAQAWRCMHCQTQKTPQWRTGPMGPKTLCNACGVRFKSGRLLPEYRPAGSPTYVASKHSHSHKKVIEMRRERELRAAHHGNHKTSNNVKPEQQQQGMTSPSSLQHLNSDFHSLETQKSFSELPSPAKLESEYETKNSPEFPKCLTSTTAVLESRLDETREL